MASATCPTCLQSYPSVQELNAHRVNAHGAVECTLCEKAFKSPKGLQLHLQSSSKKHLAQHAARCTIPGCSPQDCVGVSLKSVNINSVEPSTSSPPASTALIATTASNVNAGPIQALPGNGHCHICNKSLRGKNGVQMHMATSRSHRQRHLQTCHVQSCDPTTCFGSPPGKRKARLLADSDSPRQSTSTNLAAGSPKPRRNVVEPGPPDLAPSTTAGLGPARSGSFASADAQQKPAKDPGFTASRSSLTFDYVREVVYDSNGNAWCFRCRGSWIEPHFCSGYSRPGSPDFIPVSAPFQPTLALISGSASSPANKRPLTFVPASSPPSEVQVKKKKGKRSKGKKSGTGGGAGHGWYGAPSSSGYHEVPVENLGRGNCCVYCHAPVFGYNHSCPGDSS
ncbi:hypothetical protein BKA70DRAFT_1272672 [Coprinopsis sp. MPI-PUGE-AT-0042]|nr:hypothetical protein BKA70DRAFT_1272672 [Coprinopsis sp. MPI-PUGE-AT-0042]